MGEERYPPYSGAQWTWPDIVPSSTTPVHTDPNPNSTQNESPQNSPTQDANATPSSVQESTTEATSSGEIDVAQNGSTNDVSTQDVATENGSTDDASTQITTTNDVSTQYDPPPKPKLSKGRQRRDRKRRLLARIRPAPIPAPAVPHEVKNSLGIISVQRKDLAPMDTSDIDHVKSALDELSVPSDNFSSVDRFLRIFCDTKPLLESVWSVLKSLEPPDSTHPGYHAVLPGTRFPGARIECRVPFLVFKHYSKPELEILFVLNCSAKMRDVKCIKSPIYLPKCPNKSKDMILFLDVSSRVIDLLKAAKWMTCMGLNRVKWGRSRYKTMENKTYKRIFDAGEYWGRKKRVDTTPTVPRVGTRVLACERRDYDFSFPNGML